MLEFEFYPIKIGKGRVSVDIDVDLEDGNVMDFKRKGHILIRKPLTPTQDIQEVISKPIKVTYPVVLPVLSFHRLRWSRKQESEKILK